MPKERHGILLTVPKVPSNGLAFTLHKAQQISENINLCIL